MLRLKTWTSFGLVLSFAMLLDAGSASTQARRFSSLYTDLKTQCKAAIRVKRGEEFEGDMPLRCSGYGGYEVRIDYSAASSHLRLQPMRGNSDEAINLAMQPINYDQTHRIEWRLANGKPFAVIFRIDKSKSDQPEDKWSPENKTGESLVIKGLKGFEHIDFEVDGKTADANLQARRMADEGYARKG